MDKPSAFHQLGRFIFLFQHVESALTELLVLMAHGDGEATRILVNELEFSKRVKTTDVMFARFVDLHNDSDVGQKSEFHLLMNEVLKFGERRNALVHSKLLLWSNEKGSSGLLRQHSLLRASKGFREDGEEELLPELLEEDGDRLSVLLQKLERNRLQVIDQLYPD
jgi:hypothetical protein